MTLQCCRLCAEDVTNSHHKVAIYGTNSQGLAVRITTLLEIPISRHDGRSNYICAKCKSRVERLERSMSDLESFRRQVAPQTGHKCKRVKHSGSECGVSPDTMKARPQPKNRRLDFGPSPATCSSPIETGK